VPSAWALIKEVRNPRKKLTRHVALQSYGLHKGSDFIASKDVVTYPGPGQYNPSYVQAKGKINPSWTVSKDPRDHKFSQTAGPGDYNIAPKIGDAPKYGMGLKLEKDYVKEMRTLPGPTDYSPSKTMTTIKYPNYSMSGKHEAPSPLVPGPGQYDDKITLHYSTLPGSKIGRDSRQSYFLKSSSYEKPGPGDYEKPCFTDKSQAPKFRFGSSTRERDYLTLKSRAALPGPGNYESKIVIGHKSGCPVYSMPGRRADHRPKTGKDAPDAGLYNPKNTYSSTKPTSPEFSVNKAKRDGELALYTESPGPLAYSPTH
jgi:hypothetical protein